MKDYTMRAVVAKGYGTHEVLEPGIVKMPQLKENDLLVKIYASSATKADTMMLTGKPFIGRLFTGLLKPKHDIPGTGFAGDVVDTGEKVTLFKKGDRVFGETTLGFGTNAEFVAINEEGVILHKPDNLPYTEAVTFCDGPLTSINFLKEIGKVKPGQKVLINGASGSLGTAAVQLAKYFGAEVTAVCSTTNVGLVKSLGADHVIDYTKEDFTAIDEQFDIVYDTVGKSTFKRSKKVLAEKGLYISPVMKLSLLIQMIRTSLRGGKKAIFAASGLKADKDLRALLSELLTIFRAGKLRTVIDRQFPLEKLSQAHQYIAKGHKKGNVVIVVES
jgi:NADPH:quinone reductase-like Zn-dependent oxidoreductase